MSFRVVHLSDLHFGGAFDKSLWQSVFDAVVRCRPQLIVVSGDLVDHPIRENLESAREELVKLADNCRAILHVVPGNHDVYYFGNDVKVGRTPLFDAIFRAPEEDSKVEANPTGFDRKASGVFRAIANWILLTKTQSAPVLPNPPLIKELESPPVLLALIDSNAAGSLGLATGFISSDDLLRLDRELNSCKKHHLVRIAVVHHHVLPIAHTGGRVVGAEPFMVLENAGDLLKVLARHRFDLILHGHQHKSQFARIEFSPDTTESYPIAVAAAGSASLLCEREPRFNSFNSIKIAENGAVCVQSYFYGHTVAPDLDCSDGEGRRTFTEPLSLTKRRAFARARDRHKICCDVREWTFKISENGDLEVRQEIKGLRVTRGVEPLVQRPHRVSVPERGRLVVGLHLDQKSEQNGYRIVPKSGASDTDAVALPENLGDDGANYAVEIAFANTIMMTAWEAKQRGQDPEEWVGCLVVHPVKELVLNLVLPESLARHTQPYVRCERMRNFPCYEIDSHDDADLAGKADFEIDLDMQREEEKGLQFDAARQRWRLFIKQPVVGYGYRLRWRLPGEAPLEPVPSETGEWRRLLLSMGERCATQQMQAADHEALRLFNLLTNGLGELLGTPVGAETFLADLFAYDGTRLALRQIFCSNPSPSPPREPAFEIKLGDGIAGAAFQQRRIVPWSRGGQGPHFVRPVPYPHPEVQGDMPFSAMLAIPIYHRAAQDDFRPSPWAVIGVVAFATTAPTSRIPAMLKDKLDDADQEVLRDVRGIAQSVVHKMLTVLANSQG